MIRDVGVVRSPQAPAMKCDAAREGLYARRSGGASLTEWALVEAHLKQCAECGQAEARLQQVAALRRVAPPRALLNPRGKTMELTGAALLVPLRAFLTGALMLTGRASAAGIQAIGRGLGHVAELMARLYAVLTGALTLTARASGAGIRAIGRGLGHVAELMARLYGVLTGAITLIGRASVAGMRAIGRGLGNSAAWIARLPALLVTQLRSSVRALRAMGVLLGLAFLLYTLQWAPEARQHVQSTAVPGPRLEPTEEVSFLLAPPVAPSVELPSAAPTTPPIDWPPRYSPSRSSTSVSQAVPAPAAAREAPALPSSAAERVDRVTHVVGRLAAKDRTAGERDFTALLASVGGTELGRHHRVTFTAVEVVVPQYRYDDFARGLSRLGSWQLEAVRSPLPDAVHMTIHVSK